MQYLLNLLIPHAHAYTYFDIGDIASSSLVFAGSFLTDLSPLLKIILGALVVGVIISLIFRALHR